MNEATKAWKECRNLGDSKVYYTRDRYRLHFSSGRNVWVLQTPLEPPSVSWDLGEDRPPVTPDVAQGRADARIYLLDQGIDPDMPAENALVAAPAHPAFTPEPPPQNAPTGIPVWPALIQTLRDPDNVLGATMCATPQGKALYDQWLADMEARHQEGIKRYGVPLCTDNGRDPLVDGYQESLDLNVYAFQAHLMGLFEQGAADLQAAGINNELAILQRKLVGDMRMVSFLLSVMVHARQDKKETP